MQRTITIGCPRSERQRFRDDVLLLRVELERLAGFGADQDFTSKSDGIAFPSRDRRAVDAVPAVPGLLPSPQAPGLSLSAIQVQGIDSAAVARDSPIADWLLEQGGFELPSPRRLRNWTVCPNPSGDRLLCF
jgi:hypothetical protein